MSNTHPYTVDDLRGMCLRDLDRVCSDILGLPPPDRTRRRQRCRCHLCAIPAGPILTREDAERARLELLHKRRRASLRLRLSLIA